MHYAVCSLFIGFLCTLCLAEMNINYVNVEIKVINWRSQSLKNRMHWANVGSPSLTLPKHQPTIGWMSVVWARASTEICRRLASQGRWHFIYSVNLKGTSEARQIKKPSASGNNRADKPRKYNSHLFTTTDRVCLGRRRRDGTLVWPWPVRRDVGPGGWRAVAGRAAGRRAGGGHVCTSTCAVDPPVPGRDPAAADQMPLDLAGSCLDHWARFAHGHMTRIRRGAVRHHLWAFSGRLLFVLLSRHSKLCCCEWFSSSQNLWLKPGFEAGPESSTLGQLRTPLETPANAWAESGGAEPQAQLDQPGTASIMSYSWRPFWRICSANGNQPFVIQTREVLMVMWLCYLPYWCPRSALLVCPLPPPPPPLPIPAMSHNPRPLPRMEVESFHLFTHV